MAMGGGDAGARPRRLAPPSGEPRLEAFFSFLRREWHRLADFPPDLAETVKRELESLQLEDFNIHSDEARRLEGTGSKVGYQEVYSGSEITLCIFVLRAGAHIPLHDHPHMHVFGRLLFGRMRVTSYNPMPLEDPADGNAGRWPPRGALVANLQADHVMGPEPVTYVVGPCEGNVHELHALEDCAFFDVVVPPYDTAAGRGCTYYGLVSAPSPTGAVDVLLPCGAGDFCTVPLRYRGPPFLPPPPPLPGAVGGAAASAGVAAGGNGEAPGHNGVRPQAETGAGPRRS